MRVPSLTPKREALLGGASAALALAALIVTFARPALVSAQREGETAFEVHLSEQGTSVYIKYWPVATKFTVTFDDPATEESPDDEIEGVTSLTEEGYGGGGFVIERSVGPGEVVTLTDGTTTKSHTVLDIRVTSVDLDADRVYGMVAVPNSEVFVYATGSYRLVTADARGRWVADFSDHPDPDPGLLDIVTGTEGGAEQFDKDGDSTVRDWVGPTPTAILAPTPTPVPASGSISGTVTAGGSPLPGISVDALAQERVSSQWVIVGSATTGPAGEYEIGDLRPADYRIAFQGGATFADQYWPDQRDPDTAKTVSVTAGGVLSSINAGLVSDFRDAGPLVPTITTNIPTPADTSKEPPVVGANLLLAALAMILFTIATELLNRSLGQLDPTLRRRFRPIDRVDRARARLDAAFIGRFGGAGHARRANALRILGIAAFYGIVFALLDPTWNPFSVTGLWLVLIMAVAFGIVGLSGDIAAWATARRWGIAGDLAVKPGSLVAAVGSTLFTRTLVLVPGVMIGSPEALEVHPEGLDRRRLGGLAGVGLGTVLAIGLVAWLGTLVTTALRGGGEVVDDLVGGVEAFLLLVFAAAVQNGFVQLLSLRESAGLALRRAYRVPWAIALLAVTFAFWHTLVNPRGDLAEALGSTNVQAFLVTVGIVFAAAVAVWTALAVVRRRGVRGTEVELVTPAAIAPLLEVLVPGQMPLEAAVPGVDPRGPLAGDQPDGSTSPPASMAIAEESPEPPPAAVPAGP